MADWQSIWEARKLDPTLDSTLQKLLAADGLDTGFGSVTEQAWREYVDRVARTLGIEAGHSIFEVGCGAGAFLYALQRAGGVLAGIDASAKQIGFIREAIPEGQWTVQEAAQLNVEDPADFVIASAVFLYFPSLHYAAEVLRRMVLKARTGIAVLDIPDASKQQAALAFRQGSLGPAEYAERYEGLQHLSMDKEWLEALLPELGLTRWKIEDQAIEGYGNAPYRFNLFAWKTLPGKTRVCGED